MKFYFLVPLCALSLVACTTSTIPMSQQHAQSFDQVAPLSVAVSDISILKSGNVKSTYVGDYTVSLDEQAVSYFSKKLVAQPNGANAQERLVVSIDASDVGYAQKESEHYVLKKIGVDHVDEYALLLAVRLEHQESQTGRVIFGREIKLRKVYSISEHDSLAKRDQKRFEAIGAMFQMLDPEVDRIIRYEMRL